MPLNQKDFQVMPQEPPRQHGFTLMELMVTVSIAAVLTAIGMPSFTETIKNNRITAHVNEFVTALNFTRSEAIKRGVRVSMCKTSDAMTCMRDGAGSNWAQGWIIFTNQDDDDVFDGADEAILKIQDRAQNQITMTGSSLVDDMISYRPNGVISRPNGVVSASGTIKVCDDRIGVDGKSIAINAIGRSRIHTGVSCP